MAVSLPRLKGRDGDIALLCRHFVSRQCRLHGLAAKRISTDYLDALEAYGWPGNVRELIHAVEHSLATATNDPVLVAAHLPMNIRISLARSALPAREQSPAGAGQRAEGGFLPLRQVRQQAVAEVESRYLRELLAACGGDVPKACQVSGLSRARLYALLKTHGLLP